MSRLPDARCGECNQLVRPVFRQIGRFECMDCGLTWFEDLQDPDSYRDEKTGALPRSRATRIGETGKP